MIEAIGLRVEFAAGEELHQQPNDDRPGQEVGIGGGVQMTRAEVAGESSGDRGQGLRSA